MNALAEWLKDMVWPRTCAVRTCGRPVEDRPGSYICATCGATLPWYDEFASSAFAYLEPIDALILDYKFSGAVYLTDDFAEALETAFRRKHDVATVDVVVPVPLHPIRRRERGYNQSELLAVAFARRIGRFCERRALRRIRETEHQTRLSGDERRVNLKGAFRVVEPARIRGRTIVLVDDVMTTGSTLDECTKALKAAGAFRVIPFVLAKALMDEDFDAPSPSSGDCGIIRPITNNKRGMTT